MTEGRFFSDARRCQCCACVLRVFHRPIRVTGTKLLLLPLSPPYTMNRLQSLLRPVKAEISRSQGSGMTANNVIIATSSIINNTRGNQYITNIHSTPAAPLAGASVSSSPGPSPFNDAPIDNLSIHFTGRKKELALIAEAFQQRRNIPRRCALFGNQGVGKSQLTYSWAKSTFAREENAYIIWISATTVEKLFQGFCRLLRFVNHPDKSHPDQNVRLEAARRWLEETDTGNWLLVFDNVFPETLDFLRQHLPRVNSRGTILFTTRTQDVAVAVTSTAGERHQIIEVPLLNVEEAVQLFCRRFDAGKVDPSSPKVEAIVKAVGCLPLAILHAAAYMDQSRISLDDLLSLFQSKHAIDVISWEHTLSDYEHKSVTATFSSQLQDLDRQYPDAGKLLRVIAFFDPGSIPLEMLTTGATAIITAQQRSPFAASLLALIQSPIALPNAITQLQARCLITYHATSRSPTFRMHDLIQLVVLESMRSSGLDEESFELAVDLVCAAFAKIENPQLHEWWPKCELLVPHIQALTTWQAISSKAKKALLLAQHHRGLYLGSRARYTEAESLYESVVADRQQLFSRDDADADADTLAAMCTLSWVYRIRGRYVCAKTLLMQVAKSYETKFTAEHRDTLKTKYHLAVVYYRQERYDDAEDLLKPILESQEFQFGPEDNDTLWSMNALADVYNSQTRYNEAEALLQRVLPVRTKLLRPEHRDTLTAKHSLAKVYLSQQRYDAAAALFQQVLLVRERDLGLQHSDTLATMYFLSLVYSSRNCYEEAEKLLAHVLAGHDKVYGVSHPDTLRTVKQLLWVYEKLERMDEARVLEQRISSSSQ